MLSATRIIECVVRRSVTTLGFPPSWFGYRVFRPESPEAYIHRISNGNMPSGYTLVSPAPSAQCPLPENIASHDELSRVSEYWGYSFHSASQRSTTKTFTATLPDCRIVTFSDRWGHEFYAIFTRDHTILNIRGTGITPGNFRYTHKPEEAVTLDRASWILESWSSNYFHWLIFQLPKILVLKDQHMEKGTILPSKNKLNSVIQTSLDTLGIRPEDLHQITHRVTYVKELTVVGIDRIPGQLLRRLRALFVPQFSNRGRRVFISRRKGEKRLLINEEDLWPLLENAGFERVYTEELSFKEQVLLMSETSVLLAVHGAGLTNMLFCQPGTDVIEISDPQYPAPDYYVMANELGHRYWLINGRSEGAAPLGFHDLFVEKSAIAEVLKNII